MHSSPSLLDAPKRIKACQKESTKCLVSCCHLPTSYGAELGIFLLIWPTAGCAWSEVDVLEIVEIEGRPVTAQFPRFTYCGLWEHQQAKAALILGNVSVFRNFIPTNSFYSHDNPMQWALLLTPFHV